MSSVSPPSRSSCAAPVQLAICSGVHACEYTEHMVADMHTCGGFQSMAKRYAASGFPAVFSARHLCQQLRQQPAPTIFLGFSAGCIAAASAARYWHHQRQQTLALFAADGWGLPLAEPFPVHRLSHDLWTHLTSANVSGCHFYADPAVSHLRLWQRPSQVQGWGKLPTSNRYVALSAADFLDRWCAHYQQRTAVPAPASVSCNSPIPSNVQER